MAGRSGHGAYAGGPHRGRRRRAGRWGPWHGADRRPHLGVPGLSPPGRLARGRGGDQTAGVRARAVLGAAGARFRRRRAADHDRRFGPGRARSQPDRTQLHRRPVGRLPLRRAVSGRPGQSTDQCPRRRRAGAEPGADRRCRPLRATGQPADPGRTRHLSTLAGTPARTGLAEPACRRRAGRVRVVGPVAGPALHHGGCTRGCARPRSKVRSRRRGAVGRRGHRSGLLPREPAEHLHRPTDRTDDRRRPRPRRQL